MPGVATTQFPGVEEGRPVDEGDQFFEGLFFDDAATQERGFVDARGGPVDGRGLGAGLGEGEHLFLTSASGVLLAETLVLFARLLGKLDFLLGVEERVDHADAAGGVEDVDDRGSRSWARS